MKTLGLRLGVKVGRPITLTTTRLASSLFTKPIVGLIGLAGVLLNSQAVLAHNHLPVTAEQKRVAEQVAQAGVPLSELAPNAPDQYTVKRGDTLWDISKLFLKSPWRWPELWGMNKDQIRNPHLIYPGQMLFLDKSNGRARLRMGKPVSGGTVKLSPTVRSESMGQEAIPPIPAKDIEPFLSQPLIVEESALQKAPRVVATQDGRVMLGLNDEGYVRGITDEKATDYYVYRPVKPLRDPDTNEVLAYEAFFLGSMKVVRKATKENEATTMVVTNGKQEIGVGDRLIAAEKPSFQSYVPHASEQNINGRVLSIYGGVRQAARNQVITINRGSRDGLEIGHVLALYHYGRTITDKTNGTKEQVKLPDEKNGLVFIFRTFERVSYGLIMESEMPVMVGDSVRQP